MSEKLNMERVPFMPDAHIGGVAFEELYPNWTRQMDQLEEAVLEEIRSGNTPRAYLSDQQRFRHFLNSWVVSSPEVEISVEQVDDILPFAHDEFFGMGLLRPWLEDPRVEDVVLNTYQWMDVYQGGVKTPVTPTPFGSDKEVENWMRRMLEANGKNLSEDDPVGNGQLSDGSRISCTLPPVSGAPGFSIRKHRVERFSGDTYRQSGVAPAGFFDDLQQWVESRQNLLICGPTGSGKSTLINYTAGLIGEDERVLVVEDTRELMLQSPRAYQLTATGQNARMGRAEQLDLTLRDLVAQTLRMVPERIIVGEVRGPEAFEMLNAMNTGHSGGLTSLHANGPAEAVMRLESLAAPAQPNMPLWALQDLIATVLGVVIQMRKIPGTSQRVVVEATQVIHPMQVTEIETLSGARKLRDNLYLRILWRWDSRSGQLVRHAGMLETEGDYFAPPTD
jgi:pilus assembly protein CpaF